jgi:hypothetical protein
MGVGDGSDMESRSADGSDLGKCLERLDIPVPAELKERLVALAVVGGSQNVTRYVRDLLMRHVYGELAMLQQRVGRPVGDVDGKLNG